MKKKKEEMQIDDSVLLHQVSMGGDFEAFASRSSDRDSNVEMSPAYPYHRESSDETHQDMLL